MGEAWRRLREESKDTPTRPLDLALSASSLESNSLFSSRGHLLPTLGLSPSQHHHCKSRLAGLPCLLLPPWITWAIILKLSFLSWHVCDSEPQTVNSPTFVQPRYICLTAVGSTFYCNPCLFPFHQIQLLSAKQICLYLWQQTYQPIILHLNTFKLD